MKWYKDLLVGSSVKKRMDEIIKAVSEKQHAKGTVFILLPQNENNMYDIIEDRFLLQEYYREKELYCVGVAASKKEAANMVSDLLAKNQERHGTVKVTYSLEDFYDKAQY